MSLDFSINYRLVSYLIFLIMLGCRHPDNLSLFEMRGISKIEKQILKDNLRNEDFNSFFEYFKIDTIFQKLRTDTPYITRVYLVTINAAGDLRAYIEKSAEKNDWTLSGCTSGVPEKVEILNDSAVLTYKEIILDREIITFYTFKRKNGKWRYNNLIIKPHNSQL